MNIQYFKKYDYLFNSVKDGNLLRIYAKYKDVWFKDMPKTLAQNKIQFIIPIDYKNGLIQISYCDSYNADFWNNFKSDKDVMKYLNIHNKRRFEEKGKISLSERELDLNKQQRTVLKKVNEIINNNPNAILEDRELIDKISTRVDRDGNIYKSKIDLSNVLDPKKDARFFNLSHGKRIQLGGELLNTPANRFAAPFSKADAGETARVMEGKSSLVIVPVTAPAVPMV